MRGENATDVAAAATADGSSAKKNRKKKGPHWAWFVLGGIVGFGTGWYFGVGSERRFQRRWRADPLDRDDNPGHSNPGNPRRWRSSEVQTLLFNRTDYTPGEAKAWAREHGFSSAKVHTTDDYHRLRQFKHRRGVPCRTIEFGDGISAVVCRA